MLYIKVYVTKLVTLPGLYRFQELQRKLVLQAKAPGFRLRKVTSVSLVCAL